MCEGGKKWDFYLNFLRKIIKRLEHKQCGKREIKFVFFLKSIF